MGEFSVSNSIVVDAPIEEVFEKFNDPQTQGDWMVQAGNVRNYSPPLAVGQGWETVTEIMGRELVATLEVIELDAPHLYRATVDSAISGEQKHTFEPVDGGVKVTIIFEGETSGFLAGLAMPLLKGRIDSRMQADLESFKQFIER